MQENLHESVYNYWVSIQDKLSQFKGLFRNTDLVLSFLIIVVSLISFALGRISVGDDFARVKQESQAISPIITDTTQNLQSTTPTTTSVSPVGAEDSEKRYVASKSGTKYHLPWCGSAKQIKEENKIWFSSKEEAEKAGYTPASNCKGI